MDRIDSDAERVYSSSCTMLPAREAPWQEKSAKDEESLGLADLSAAARLGGSPIVRESDQCFHGVDCTPNGGWTGFM